VKGLTSKAGIASAALLLWGTLLGSLASVAQTPAVQTPATPAPQAATPQLTTQATPSDAAQGGTIKGTVIAGTVGKPGGVPLPGVAITAKNSLTGKQYTTTTDIDGNYAMSIPKNGRYVVRVELIGFAAETHEVILNGGVAAAAKDADFGMELASRAAAAQAQAQQASNATSLQRGLQGLNLTADSSNADDATAPSAANSNTGAALPSLASLSGIGDNNDAAADSVAVSGQSGQMNGLAGVSEDEIRNRINDAVAAGQANGSIPPGGDVTNTIVNMLGGMIGMGAPGGQGGPGQGRGNRGAQGAGNGAFRNFNPAQPHGSIYYTGGNAALNSSSWNITSPGLPHFKPNPSAYSNKFGASIAGSPYIPGLTKPNTKQFVFINMNGQKNLNAFSSTGTVPTSPERAGNFLGATYGPNGTPITLYDPVTGQPLLNNNLANASVPISAAAQQVLAYYPLCNVSPTCDTTLPSNNNYQTITNAGSNAVTLNTRYVRQLGAATNTPFGRFGANGAPRPQRGQNGQNANQPPALRQNINIGYNFSHSASDIRNIFLPLGGATATTGNSLNLGYVISYGRLSNNASVNWNRSNSETRNYFTDSTTNPNATAGLHVPTQTGNLADPRFYNGLASFSFSSFTGISNQTPSQTINQTISYSDFIAYRHKGHNWRTGFDIRRVHADSIGGNNPLGRYTFSGYATASPASQVAGTAGVASGNGFADFLLGLPESTSIQAGLYKDYLRENVYDGYLTDDWRARGNLTFNYGLRYEYFGPYTEKNGRLVNLTGISAQGYANIGCVTPAGISYPNPAGSGTITCAASNGLQSLVTPDRDMFAPRVGFAYRPKFKWKPLNDWVIRGGYGINYNTGQYAVFAKLLSHQEPFSVTQTNDFPLYSLTSATVPSATGCTTTQSAYTYTNSQGQTVTRPATTANLSLSNPNSGFNCSTQLTLTNNWAVDRNYRLGMVQIYNLNLQKTLPLQMVFNLGYNGSKASGLDVVGSPNASPSGVSTPGMAPFDFEESLASSHSNQLVVSLQKRQQKGIALGFTYVYSHSIDNASGVGGAVGTPIQNFYNLAAEEGNSSFDQRHKLTGNWVTELPFGPNRAFLNKGGVLSRILDGFSLSGDFTFASGNYFTPQYSGSESEAASGNTFTQRPDRVLGQSLTGPGNLAHWFNTAAFAAPAGIYGTASQGSIEGPGTVSADAALSRTVQMGGTNSLEARVTASNVFNTVQYSGISVTQNSATFGEVSGAAPMRALTVLMRYRF